MNPLVLRVITRLNVGGPARHVHILNRDLPSRGFDTELVYGREALDEGRLPPPDGAHATYVPDLARPLHPLRDVRAFAALKRIMAGRRPRIVHTHMAKAGALGRVAARRAGVPITVHTFHGHVLEGYFGTPIARAFVETERRLARRTTALVAVSPQVRDELLALGIGSPDQWHVIPVGLDLDELVRSQVGAEEGRLRLGIPLDGPVVGIVGRLVPIKDHDTFLEAAGRVAARNPDVRFVVAGDGERRAELEAKARGLLGERVHFTGWVSDLAALYAACDVVVLTSRNEGTPIALIEAGASGVPVVATDVGGVPHVVSDGRTGWLVSSGDATAVAEAILRVVGDPAAARAMGEHARAEILGRFGAARLVDDVADLYRSLLSD